MFRWQSSPGGALAAPVADAERHVATALAARARRLPYTQLDAVGKHRRRVDGSCRDTVRYAKEALITRLIR